MLCYYLRVVFIIVFLFFIFFLMPLALNPNLYSFPLTSVSSHIEVTIISDCLGSRTKYPRPSILTNWILVFLTKSKNDQNTPDPNNLTLPISHLPRAFSTIEGPWMVFHLRQDLTYEPTNFYPIRLRNFD